MKLTIALLQIAPIQNDQDKNLEKGIRCCREAKGRGADLIIFTELWNIGSQEYPIDVAGMADWESSAIDQNDRFFKEFLGSRSRNNAQHRDHVSGQSTLPSRKIPSRSSIASAQSF